MILFFDTETTGLPVKGKPPTDAEQPRLVQIAAILTDDNFQERSILYTIVKPVGFIIPNEASRIHKITTACAHDLGMPNKSVLHYFSKLWERADLIVCHNTAYDLHILATEFGLYGATLDKRPTYCTMLHATPILKLPGKFSGYKWPRLSECIKFFFKENIEGAHDALVDIRATIRLYIKLQELARVGGSVETEASGLDTSVP